ncbi:hypothetical protein ACFL1S_02560, partial [Pseudomonadota bacterium]
QPYQHNSLVGTSGYSHFFPWQDDGSIVFEDPSVQALVEDALSSTQTAARQRIERYREKQWLRQRLQGLDGFSGNSV